MSNKNLLPVALGKEKADIVFKNGKIIDVFNERIIEEDLAVSNGKIIGWGNYSGVKEIDLNGKYISPGFIDAHLHLESTMVSVEEFAKTVIPLGTLTIVADPHEIANVAGEIGVEYFLNLGKNLPWNFNLMIPSCVPVTPFDNSGAVLDALKIKEMLSKNQFFGLGEVMDFEGIINGQDYIWDKIELMQNYFIDGHAPKLKDKLLNAYLLAGIRADHETTTSQEALEKVSKGLYVMVREGSVTRDLESILPAINDSNVSYFLFATDDRHPEDLLSEGHINFMIKKAISLGMNPLRAIRLATINAAKALGINYLGAIAPGYQADLIIVENLNDLTIKEVYKDGMLVAKEGKFLFSINSGNSSKPEPVFNSIKIPKIKENDFHMPQGETYRIMSLIKDQIVTKLDFFSPKSELYEDELIKNGINKIAVVERYQKNGKIGLGLLKEFNLKSGAIASSIAHDSHNIIVIGSNSYDMKVAVEKISELHGGIVVTKDGNVLDFLPLPVGGLVSEEPIEYVSQKLKDLRKIVYDLGVKIQSPFMTLAFMGLPVVPELKITCEGLYDVVNHSFVSLVLE
ncbi:adenine deaminase [Petrotoga halophila]|uniref:Adenine deaminase n=1 Tax=Petrotoga halophila DSM 16923 TaxID=1122953 RepID=A0A2S5EDY4_9BACT|nr:adenine deaminase [Petrotoga halophila]POZ91239.1 adenine deaminase [Petrotoga halophila DSM 16923]